MCLTCKHFQKQNYKYAKENNEQWEAKPGGKQRATHIDITGGLEDGWRLPLDETIMVEGGFRHRGDVVVAVRTAILTISILVICNKTADPCCKRIIR